MSEFDEKQFYDFGFEIAKAYAHEAAYRTAIGRIYYACYLTGAKATKNKGWFSPKYSAGDHAALRQALKDRLQYGLADKLFDLYRLREHADYHICPTEECRYCHDAAPDEDLVGSQTWSRARAIARNIFPKLQSINPRKSGN
jgi:hypothetical protein